MEIQQAQQVIYDCFGEQVSQKDAIRLLSEAKKHAKDFARCVYHVRDVFVAKQEKPKDLVAVLMTEIKGDGWSIPVAGKLKKPNTQSMPKAIIAQLEEAKQQTTATKEEDKPLSEEEFEEKRRRIMEKIRMMAQMKG